MTSQTQQHAGVRLERAFPQPPHLLYRAWLELPLVRLWMAPGGQEVTRAQIEERPGGACRTWKADGGVIVGCFDSELLELDPGPSGGTALRLVHEWLDELTFPAMPHIAGNVRSGCEAVLTWLEHALTADATARAVNL